MPAKRNQKQRRRQIRAQNELIRWCKRKGSPCQHGDSRAVKTMRRSTPYPCLPEDIWHHIHSQMPMRDAARAACLSRTFLQSWRSHPNLILNKDTIGLNASACGGNFSRKVDHIMRNHSGIGVKIFRLEYLGVVGFDASRYLDNSIGVPFVPLLNSAPCKALQACVCVRGVGAKLSLGETLKMKKLGMGRANAVHYARAELPSIMPNLETLNIRSGPEAVNTPVLPTKFLYLKHLSISLIAVSTLSPSYDYFSLVQQRSMEHESVFAKSSGLRQIPENRHDSLKTVKISGFCSAKSLVELTCYILKNVVSLESLTLDTIHGDCRCYLKTSPFCNHIEEDILMEAPRALSAIRRYIEKIVPTTYQRRRREKKKQANTTGTKMAQD
uniref:F-box domain-containing protein n=1 Tax=Oryza nivara TaxID=4536 RepID=A0A0E0HIV2_ORYNI